MNFRKYIERIKYMDELIRKEETGKPEELARKLSISKTQLYSIIDYLKDEGLAISYTRKRGTFYYTSDTKLELVFSLKVISEKQSMETLGGNIFFRPIFPNGRNIDLY